MKHYVAYVKGNLEHTYIILCIFLLEVFEKCSISITDIYHQSGSTHISIRPPHLQHGMALRDPVSNKAVPDCAAGVTVLYMTGTS